MRDRNSSAKSMKTNLRSKRVIKTDYTFGINQIKLAVATELRLEGYSTIIFDKIIEGCGRKVRIHVYCEDDLGMGEAVYCVNETHGMNLEEVSDVIKLIKAGLAKDEVDCTVSLAFPLSLLRKASALIRLVPKVYMVDEDGRVWVHYPWSGTRRIEFLINNIILGESIEGDSWSSAVNTQMRPQPYYII
ncbi:MAG: hypothetical protein QXV82_10120 [Ignisphaera sp.]